MRTNDLFVLNEGEINRIHSDIFKVLQKVGIKVLNASALRLLHDAQCSVDFKTGVAKIPAEVLQDALSSVPRAVTLYGQNPKYDVRIGYGSATYMVGASAARYIIDVDSERRIATLKDLKDTTRFYDYLGNCHIMQQAVVPSDIAEHKHDRITFATLMANSYKHNWTWPEDPSSIDDHIAMAATVLGNTQVKDKPVFSEGLCLMCPLQISDNVAEMLMTAAKRGIPLFVEVDPMMGATAPVTVAATLVMQTATILGGIVIAQLVNRGVPCVSVLASGIMEMKNGNFAGATPEVTLSYIGAIQIARRYGIPIVVGSSIDSNFSDTQAGFEKVLQLLPLLSAKPDIIHLSIGMLEQMMLVSYAQGIIDNEMINACNRFIEGIDVTDETLAFDVINEVGHGGDYLSHPHTLELFRKELWIPDVSVREKRDVWESRGRKNILQVANDIAKNILEKHHPKPLSDSEERELFETAEGLQTKANRPSRRMCR